MEEKERKAIYKKAMDLLGYQSQMLVAVEEMAELTDDLVKKERGRATDDDVIGEIADVIVCMEQMAIYYGVEKVVAMKDAKLRRLAARLETYERKLARIEQFAASEEKRLMAILEQPSMAATPTDGDEGGDGIATYGTGGGDDPGPRGELGHLDG